MGTSLKASTDGIRSNLYLSPSSTPWALSQIADPGNHIANKSKFTHTVQHPQFIMILVQQPKNKYTTMKN